jgi:anthranilate synthase component 2
VPARQTDRQARLFVLDNHDSFTWNLVQAFEAMGAVVTVARADAEPLAALRRARPDGVVVSPGPGAAEDAAAALAVVRSAAASGLPLLGVCLGHQALAVAFGGRTGRAARPRHGKSAALRHDGRGLFAGLPDPLEAMLYHSLVVDEASLPASLAVTARGPDGEVMALRHRRLPLAGVQFHPESVGTPAGPALLANFLAGCTPARAERTAEAPPEEPHPASGKRAALFPGREARSEPQASEAHQAGAAA